MEGVYVLDATDAEWLQQIQDEVKGNHMWYDICKEIEDSDNDRERPDPHRKNFPARDTS